jgi:hypothetical protein
LGSFVYCLGSDDEITRLFALDTGGGQEVWSGLPGEALRLGPVSAGKLYLAASQPGTSGDDAVLAAFEERM